MLIRSISRSSREAAGRATLARRLSALLLSGLLIAGPFPGVALAQSAPAARLQRAHPISDSIAEAARRFGVPVPWIRAVMGAESAGDPRAVSRKGAMGLMQVMPDTWSELRARYGLGRDPFDPHDNILAGAAYLREMHDRYGSPGFLAAYNAGPQRYDEYLAGVRALPAETRAYVAVLAPLIGGKPLDDAATIAPDPLAWTRSPLFVVRANGNANAALPREQRTPGDNAPTPRAHDAAALSPRSSSLFVAQTGPDPQQ
ncbi:lytic transglycosylase domain-containing protein [Rhodopila sp.]|jgi:soluble lytic murein transglycosylase-like protein|uniref:lytic transglycosylase domain-containing protein n=1 Tax=Rhodopila sp. TaxID=2480087 RepID=UPI002CD09851|nr:lytic transglycosylase domain-containing protein [Rhodopila sp.]HVZ07924.1 lytic transglycosylase domain-containing protein [Rhodopila sp.]